MAVDVVGFDARTTTGTLDVTGALGGATPTGCIVVLTRATTEGAAADNLSFSVGFASGTGEVACVAGESEVGGSSNTQRLQSATNVINLMVAGTNAVIAAVSALITNGVRLNFTTVNGTAYRGFVILFGDDYECHAELITTGAVDTPVDVTSPGFQPDMVFAANAVLGSTDSVSIRLRGGYIGAAANDGSATQGGVVIAQENGLGTTAPSGRVSTAYSSISITSESFFTGYEVGSFDSSGFSVTPRNTSAATRYAFMAVRHLNGGTGRVSSFNSPTTADSNFALPSYSGNWVTALRILALSGVTAYDTDVTNGDGSGVGMGVLAGENEFSMGLADEDAQGTADTESLVNSKAIHFHDHTGAAFFEAARIDIDALNFSQANGTVRKWLSFDMLVPGFKPGAASLAISTFAPTVIQGTGVFTPDAAQLALSTTAPSLSEAKLFAPGVAQLAISTFAPTLVAANVFQPGAVDLTIDLKTPTLVAGNSIVPPGVDLTLSTTAPTMQRALIRAPGVAQLAITTSAPLLGRTIPVGKTDLTISTGTPLAFTSKYFTPPALDLSISTFAPVMTKSVIKTPAHRDLVILTTAPLVSGTGGTIRQPGRVNLTITPGTPRRIWAGSITVPKSDLVISTTAPGTHRTHYYTPGAAQLSIEGQKPVIQIGLKTFVIPYRDLMITTSAPTFAVSGQQNQGAGWMTEAPVYGDDWVEETAI